MKREVRPKMAVRAATLALTLTMGCADFQGLTLAKARDLSDSDARTCVHARPPEAPIVPPLSFDNEFVVAVRKVDLGEPDSAGHTTDFRNVGFDLDNTCTGQGEAPTCRRRAGAEPSIDGPGGRDNAMFGFFSTQAAGGPNTTNSNQSAEIGVLTAVMRISGYNGATNDGSVEVALYAASACHIGASKGMPKYVCPTDEGGSLLWDGRDVWTPLVDWIEPVLSAGGDPTYDYHHPKYRSTHAYVAGGMLIAHFDRATGGIAIRFSDLWIQARIERWGGEGDKLWALRDGMETGRANVDDLLATNEFLVDPETGDRICMDSEIYKRVRPTTCNLADIRFDGNDPSALCDAASWAWKFEAEPAQLGPGAFMVREADLRTCGDQSPKNDHCDLLDGG